MTSESSIKEFGEPPLPYEPGLQPLIGNTTDLIWSVDTNLSILSANQAFISFMSQYHGKPVYPGLNMKECIQSSDQYVFYEKAFAGDSFMVVFERVINDEPHQFEIHFNPILNKDLEIIGVGCSSRDVTSHKRSYLQIEAQNKALKEIAWSLSHEVRGPIATILGLIPLIDYENPVSEDNAEILQGIKSLAEKLDDLTRRLNKKTFTTH